MINILRFLGKEAHSQSIATKEQMMPVETAGQTELTDEQLDQVIGGCSQYQSNGEYHPGGHNKQHHQHYGSSSSQNPWQPNSGQNQWQPNSGRC